MHTQTILGAFSCRSGGQLEGGTWDESSTHTAHSRHSTAPRTSMCRKVRLGSDTVRQRSMSWLRCKHAGNGRASRARMDRSFCLPITCTNRRTGARSRREPTTTMPRTATVYWTTRCGPINCSDQPRHPVPSSTDYKQRQHNTSWTSSLSPGPPAARPIGNR